MLQIAATDITPREAVYTFIYSGFAATPGMARIWLKWLVGAGRFERPTPCAQGSGPHQIWGDLTLGRNTATKSSTSVPDIDRKLLVDY